MSGGYILDFTNQSFATLFQDAAGIKIYDQKYGLQGGSKANRMRSFWDNEPNITVGKVLQAMLELWRYHNPTKKDHHFDECQRTVARLLGHDTGIPNTLDPEQVFLHKDYGVISFGKLQLESALVLILEARHIELQRAMQADCPLMVVLMCGSILEGVLLGVARNNIQLFNQSSASPKDKENKVKRLNEWTLSNLIDVACDVGLLGLDVKKFGHALRDFRNYIHPYEQLASRFNPSMHTAQICFQVLRTAIAALSKKM